jgi:hypothetical protein
MARNLQASSSAVFSFAYCHLSLSLHRKSQRFPRAPRGSLLAMHPSQLRPRAHFVIKVEPHPFGSQARDRRRDHAHRQRYGVPKQAQLLRRAEGPSLHFVLHDKWRGLGSLSATCKKASRAASETKKIQVYGKHGTPPVRSKGCRDSTRPSLVVFFLSVANDHASSISRQRMFASTLGSTGGGCQTSGSHDPKRHAVQPAK